MRIFLEKQITIEEKKIMVRFIIKNTHVKMGIKISSWAYSDREALKAGVNIFKNLPRILGEKFPNFLGSWEEFDEIQLRTCCRDLEWWIVNYSEGKFSECKEEYYPIKRYCFPWWGEIKCKSSKNVRIYAYGEK